VTAGHTGQDGTANTLQAIQPAPAGILPQAGVYFQQGAQHVASQTPQSTTDPNAPSRRQPQLDAPPAPVQNQQHPATAPHPQVPPTQPAGNSSSLTVNNGVSYTTVEQQPVTQRQYASEAAQYVANTTHQGVATQNFANATHQGQWPTQMSTNNGYAQQPLFQPDIRSLQPIQEHDEIMIDVSALVLPVCHDVILNYTSRFSRPFHLNLTSKYLSGLYRRRYNFLYLQDLCTTSRILKTPTIIPITRTASVKRNTCTRTLW
jgi:hypothetical protein